MYWAGLFPRKYSHTSQEKQKWPSREKILPHPLFKVVAAWIKQPKDPTLQKIKGKNMFIVIQAVVTTFAALLIAQKLQLLMQEKTVVQLLILHRTFS